MTAACLHGRKEVVQYVLEEGADIGAPNSKTFPPLLCAVKSGKWEIADTLLLAGADIEQTDKYGRTPLMIAASEGHLGVLEMLVGVAVGSWGYGSVVVPFVISLGHNRYILYAEYFVDVTDRWVSESNLMLTDLFLDFVACRIVQVLCVCVCERECVCACMRACVCVCACVQNSR